MSASRRFEVYFVYQNIILFILLILEINKNGLDLNFQVYYVQFFLVEDIFGCEFKAYKGKVKNNLFIGCCGVRDEFEVEPGACGWHFAGDIQLKVLLEVLVVELNHWEVRFHFLHKAGVTLEHLLK